MLTYGTSGQPYASAIYELDKREYNYFPILPWLLSPGRSSDMPEVKLR